MHNCLFCKNPTFTSSPYEDTLFNNKRFSYVKCQSCGLVQVDPLPTVADYEAMYTMDYYNYTTHSPSPIHDQVFADIKAAGSYTTFLDYGCGNGRYLVNALDKGYKVTGTDFGYELIERLKKSYPAAGFIEINDFYKDDSTFDIIFVSNVFEHLTNPGEILALLFKRLNVGGILVCDGPIENNFTLAESFRKLLFGTRKFVFKKTVSHAPKHIFYSNYQNQLDFFTNAGLSTIKYKAGETMWPFPLSYAEAEGLKGKLFWLIAVLSVSLDKLIPKSGNNFYYIGRKAQ